MPSLRVFSGRVLQQCQRHETHPGRAVERGGLEASAHPEPDRGDGFIPGWRVVHLGHRVYGGRVLRRRGGHPGRAVERDGLEDPAHPEPDRGDGFTPERRLVTSATACKAVGYYSNTSGTNAAAAENWNGTVWRIQPTPTPAGTMDSYLNGVSCTSVTACTAVGYYENASGTEVTLAERYS